MAGKFELYRCAAGHYRFRLRTDDGEEVLASEAYPSKSDAEAGIASVRKHAPIDRRYERKTAGNGRYSFKLTAADHAIIGSSEPYTTESARESGIKSVKTNAISAGVDDKT